MPDSKSRHLAPSMRVRLVRSMRPLVSERWGSEISCRIPSLRHTLCNSGAPSEYQRAIVSEPLKLFTASKISSADFLLAGYAANQPVALSRTTRVVVSLTRAGLVEFRLMAKTESEVAKSPNFLGSSDFYSCGNRTLDLSVLETSTNLR